MSAATTLPAATRSLDDVLDDVVGDGWMPLGCGTTTGLAHWMLRFLREAALGEAVYEGELAWRLLKRDVVRVVLGTRTLLELTDAGRAALAALETAVLP